MAQSFPVALAMALMLAPASRIVFICLAKGMYLGSSSRRSLAGISMVQRPVLWNSQLRFVGWLKKTAIPARAGMADAVNSAKHVGSAALFLHLVDQHGSRELFQNGCGPRHIGMEEFTQPAEGLLDVLLRHWRCSRVPAGR